MATSNWDIYNLEGETNVDRLKSITAELSGLRGRMHEAVWLRRDLGEVRAIRRGYDDGYLTAVDAMQRLADFLDARERATQ